MERIHRHLFVSLLFVLIYTGDILAQEPQIAYSLENDETGTTKNYVARESITLKQPFHYVASDSTNFNAKIDVGLLFPPTTNIYATSSGTITDATQGCVVGSIPGIASVSSSGASLYQIPIDIPAGIFGMQPQISVTYDNQSGFGCLGIGWDIAGLSSISRISQNLYFDEVDGKVESYNINFSMNDRLSLDGNRLILLNGTHFSANAEYGTEIEDYSRIKILISDITGAIYFSLTTKDGKVYEYGRTFNSLVYSDTENIPTDILSWRLNKITDIFGNYIEYTYMDHGQYLSKINYTGTVSTSACKSINFTYEENIYNPKTSYIGNFKIVHNKILSNIITCSNQTELRKYYFTYDSEKRLEYVTEYAQNDEKLNATKIDWGSGSSIQEVYVAPVNNTDITSSEEKGFVETGDIDGDGYLDKIEYWLGTDEDSVGYFKVYLYDEDTHLFSTTPTTTTFSYTNIGYKPQLIISNIDDDV